MVGKSSKRSSKVSDSARKGMKTILIITEKPQAAAKIASALSNASDEKITNKNKVSYYEFYKDGKRFLVGCAVGHLYGIQQKEARGPFPNFEVEWKPSFEKKGGAFTKKYFDVLKNLCKEADEFVVATDYDVEGEVIGWNVVRFICGKQKKDENLDEKAKRAKFSSLTKDSLEEAFDNLQENLNWNSAIAGETRHYLDWFYGINLSRGLMKALSSTGKFRILSIGRVQGPALKIVVEREREIESFKAEPFWNIFLNVESLADKKLKAEVKYPKDIFEEKELLKFKHLKGKKGIAETKIKEEKVSPPSPFDLTTLQTECYRFFGLTPSQTLRIAQSLYLAGVISYPRTSSQKYPEGIGYEKILKQLKKYTTLTKYAVNKKPVEGKKSDPAHPAIYPTGESKKITGQNKKVYDLIVKRFISCFCDAAKVETKRLVLDVNGVKFSASGKKILEKNWMAVYPNKNEDKEIPTINGEVDVKEIRIEEEKTSPPKRYSAASLVKELEKRGLGTKATRASIVETLFSRGYVSGKAIEVSDLGMQMAKTLEKFSPVILDEELTREIEKEMEAIENEKNLNKLRKEEAEILENAKKTIIKIADGMTKNLEKIGKSLEDANEKVWEAEKEANTMTTCPVCGKGKLRIMYGRKFKRYFVSCDAYPKCKTTFSLPPKGKMMPAKKKDKDTGNEEQEMCKECGFPLVVSMRKGSRPWKFCFNPECPSNKEWQKKKEEYKKKIENGEVNIDKGKN